jgi:hypothetical protein
LTVINYDHIGGIPAMKLLRRKHHKLTKIILHSK